jgi:hypothetical protein
VGAKEEHVLDVQTGTHVSTSSGDDGACLASHESTYKESDSCSHRWQAYRQAQVYKHWYDYPAYASLEGSDVLPPSSLPHGRSWDLGASQQWAIGEVPNFRRLACAPYWHNAHHVIPRSVLNGCLLDAARTDMRLFWVVRVGLMEAKYNLNHQKNMVILPMRQAVAEALCLPRHIAGIDTQPGEIPERCDHPAYSALVADKVRPIVRAYADQIDKGVHVNKAGAFAKAKLERVSSVMYMKLRDWGAVARGLSIDALPSDAMESSLW